MGSVGHGLRPGYLIPYDSSAVAALYNTEKKCRSELNRTLAKRQKPVTAYYSVDDPALVNLLLLDEHGTTGN